MADPLVIAGRTFCSRLLLGTGKFPSHTVMASAVDAAACEIVTVALRRVDIDSPSVGDLNDSEAHDSEEGILDALDLEHVLLLTNTSGAIDASEAVRLARLARAAGLPDWIKLEVTPDPRYLLPDPVETLRAAETLVSEGFTVLPYINADPVLAKKLEEVGCATVMPLGSWIGSNRGLRAREGIEIIIEQSLVPVVVDAGIGAPSHATEALEIGADAVLVNTAIGTALNPAAMARAFRLAVEAGRAGYLAGLAPSHSAAAASSPLTGFLDEPVATVYPVGAVERITAR